MPYSPSGVPFGGPAPPGVGSDRYRACGPRAGTLDRLFERAAWRIQAPPDCGLANGSPPGEGGRPRHTPPSEPFLLPVAGRPTAPVTAEPSANTDEGPTFGIHPRSSGAPRLPSPDPAWKVASLRAQDAAIARVAAKRGMTVEAYVDAVNQRIRSLVEPAEIFVRMPAGVMVDFLRRGRWATPSEGIATSVSPCLRVRRAVEDKLFHDRDERYGTMYCYLAGQDAAADHSALAWYGGAILWLGREVRPYASFVIGDSADYADYLGFLPQPLTDLSEAYRANYYEWNASYAEAVALHPGLKYSPDPLDHHDLRTLYPYIEVELHGIRPTFDNIVGVTFTGGPDELYRNPRNAFRHPREAEEVMREVERSGLTLRVAQAASVQVHGVRAEPASDAAGTPPTGPRRKLLERLQHHDPQLMIGRRPATHKDFFLPGHPGLAVKVSDPSALDPDASLSAAGRLARLEDALRTYRAGRETLRTAFGGEHVAAERAFVVPELPFDLRAWPELRGGPWEEIAPGVVVGPAMVRVQERLPPVREPFFYFLHRSGAQQELPAAPDLVAAYGAWLRGGAGPFDAALFDRVERNSSSVSDLIRAATGLSDGLFPGLDTAFRDFLEKLIRLVNDSGQRPQLFTRVLFMQREGAWSYVLQDGLHDAFRPAGRLGASAGTVARVREGEVPTPAEFGAMLEELEYVTVVNAASHAMGLDARIALPGAELLDARFAENLRAIWSRQAWELGWHYEVNPCSPGAG